VGKEGGGSAEKDREGYGTGTRRERCREIKVGDRNSVEKGIGGCRERKMVTDVAGVEGSGGAERERQKWKQIDTNRYQRKRLYVSQNLV